MKIAHITTVHPADDIRIYHKQYKSMSGIFQTYLIAPEGNIKDDTYIPIKKERGLIGRITIQPLAFKAITKLNPDIIQIHDPELIPMALFLRKIGYKIVLDMHEDLPKQIMKKEWIPKSIRPLVSKISKIFLNTTISKFDAIIFATDSIKSSFNYRGITSVVKNYPILKEFMEPAVTIQGPANQFVYVGGISKERGIHEMLRAVEITKETHHIHLAIAGKAGSAMQETLKATSSIKYYEWLSRIEIAQLIKNSVAGLVVLEETPNHLESLPIKMFEYMAAGIPVIASNFPLWEKIINDYSCGIMVDPKSPLEISNAMKFYLDNPQKAIVMGNNGKRAILDELNWEKESEKLISMYQRMR